MLFVVFFSKIMCKTNYFLRDKEREVTFIGDHMDFLKLYITT